MTFGVFSDGETSANVPILSDPFLSLSLLRTTFASIEIDQRTLIYELIL